MRTWVKIVLILSIITGIIVAVVSGVYTMPSDYSFTLVKELQEGKRYIPDIGHYIIFWASVFIIVVLTSLLFVTLFWRNTKRNLIIPNGEDKSITIQLEAIKSIINAKIKEKNYFSSFKSKIKITRHKKISCKIKGDIVTDTNISGKMKNLEQEIDQVLKDMFGTDSELIKTSVTVKAKGKPVEKNKESRVV